MKSFLQSAKAELLRYKQVGEKTMAQLPDEALFWQYNEESNSIATIVKHLWGNMLSRWTDFLNSDGEKEWRERDAEFENDLKSREAILEKWKEGWECVFYALDTLNDDNLNQTVFIRNEPHSVTEAINRQLAHYAYHIGQIVYIGKMMRNQEWESLSIPRGGSRQFNAGMQGKDKA